MEGTLCFHHRSIRSLFQRPVLVVRYARQLNRQALDLGRMPRDHLAGVGTALQRDLQSIVSQLDPRGQSCIGRIVIELM